MMFDRFLFTKGESDEHSPFLFSEKVKAMAKSKLRFSEVDELTDQGALEHSREKYVRYQDDEEEEKNSDQEENEGARKNYQSKHTLDSDEEEEVKYKKLDVDKVCCFILASFLFKYLDSYCSFA